MPFGIDDALLLSVGIPAITGLIGGAASLIGGNAQADATTRAAKIQADAANNATQLQRDQVTQQRADSEPFRQGGLNAFNQASDIASNYKPFTFDPNQDPGYQFRLSEGMKAVQNSAATRGGLLSGSTMKAMNNYAQNYASGERQNAFNNYITERDARLNPLLSLAGVGQTANGQMGQAGQNYANNAGNLQVGAANALAQGYTGAANATTSGYVGGANALNSAVAGGYNNYQNQLLLNKLLGKTGTTPNPTGFGSYSGYDSGLG